MPIPPLDINGLLPAHLGDPTNLAHLSPYPCSTLELCERFATSPERIAILRGLLQLRERLNALNVTLGYQWLNGSFLGNIEAAESRPPGDIDVVTFLFYTDANFIAQIAHMFPESTSPVLSKQHFHVDHYFVNVALRPQLTVEVARYWLTLFSHRRDGLWKGMLRIELHTPGDDTAAIDYLNNIP
jgi:hypothetical protein